MESGDGPENVADQPSPISDVNLGLLKRIAVAMMRRESVGHTLSATALVHEAWMRMATEDDDCLQEADLTKLRSHAAQVMRNVLVDYARRRNTLKRGGGRERVVLSDDLALTDGEVIDLLDLHAALDLLAEVKERAAIVVERQSFGGMTRGQVAESLGVARATVDADLTFARAWLRQKLSQPSP